MTGVQTCALPIWIKPASPELDPHRRDSEEARTLYEILQDRVLPLYYARTEGGYSPGWIRMAKRSMASLLPRYDASRMLGEYVSKYYIPASRQGHRYAQNGYEAAKAVSAWKAKVRAAWSGVTARRLDTPADDTRGISGMAGRKPRSEGTLRTGHGNRDRSGAADGNLHPNPNSRADSHPAAGSPSG